MRTEIDVAAAPRALATAWGPDAPEDSLAKSLARKLHGTVPQIMGVGPDRADRLPVEDPDQRERQDTGILR